MVELTIHASSIYLVVKLWRDLNEQVSTVQRRATIFLLFSVSLNFLLGFGVVLANVFAQSKISLTIGQLMIRLYFASGLVYLYTLGKVVLGFGSRRRTVAGSSEQNKKSVERLGDIRV